MNSRQDTLLKAATIFEKLAKVLDEEEKLERQQKLASLNAEYLEPISKATNMDKSLQEKLANTDPEILALLKSAAVKDSEAYDYGLGGPTEKVASHRGSDDPLLAFCMADD